MTSDISARFNRRRTEDGNADYVRTGRLFALNAPQADEAIAILTKELDPRGRRPYSLFVNSNNLTSSQQQRLGQALALHTRRHVETVDLSQPGPSATNTGPAPARQTL